jgi:hypothetical protein
MKCFFFGHKLSPINSDGYQYCNRCGKANKPNPCENGHIWEDVNNITPKKINHYLAATIVDFEVYQPQKCKVCGERRSVNVFD